MDMNAEGYEELARVLRAAFDQAAHGKGAVRHARGNPFEDQHMQKISNLLASHDGMAFQVIKKLTEALAFTDHHQREHELLGVIVYVAGIVVWHRGVDQDQPRPEPARRAFPCQDCGCWPCECTGFSLGVNGHP